jgi:hypothetical protein
VDELNVSAGLEFLQISNPQLQQTASEDGLQVISLNQNTNRDSICEQILNEFTNTVEYHDDKKTSIPLLEELSSETKTPTQIFDLIISNEQPIIQTNKKDLEDDSLFKKPSNDFLKPKSSAQHFELVKLENLEQIKEPSKKQIIILSNDKNKKEKTGAAISSSKLGN